MSEHRRGDSGASADVVSFPDRETAAFVERFLTAAMPRAEERRRYIDSGYLGIDTLLNLQREMFEEAALLWAGLPPAEAQAFVDRLASGWRELTELRGRNAERAKQMAERQRKGAK